MFEMEVSLMEKINVKVARMQMRTILFPADLQTSPGWLISIEFSLLIINDLIIVSNILLVLDFGKRSVTMNGALPKILNLYANGKHFKCSIITDIWSVLLAE